MQKQNMKNDVSSAIQRVQQKLLGRTQSIEKMDIQCFSYSNNSDIYTLSFPLLQDYCDKHGYDFQPYHKNLENNYKPHWNKVHYATHLLEQNLDYDYFVWFDHDIIIKNFDIKLEDIITEYNFHTLETLFMMSQDPASHQPFNTGVIIFKNTPEVLNIFKKFISMRDNPTDYPLLLRYGGYNFHSGLQDTRVMLSYFREDSHTLLSVPHRVLQSFYGQAHFYQEGDFCGHVAGPQGVTLISTLKELRGGSL